MRQPLHSSLLYSDLCGVDVGDEAKTDGAAIWASGYSGERKLIQDWILVWLKALGGDIELNL